MTFIDHVGIVVKSIEDAVPFYRKALGLEVSHREEVPAYRVRVAFLQAGQAAPSLQRRRHARAKNAGRGQAAVELVEPTGEGPIRKFLEKRGPGMHHLAFFVGDIKGEMKRLRGQGLAPIESAPRPGSRGHLVCFLRPEYADGVLVELVQHA